MGILSDGLALVGEADESAAAFMAELADNEFDDVGRDGVLAGLA